MKKIVLILILMTAFMGCKEDDFWKRFGPEVLFYQYDRVETADFIDIELEDGVTEFLVKARVSAPNELGRIDVYRDNVFVAEVTDFSNEPKLTEYLLSQLIDNVTEITKIKVVATDKNGKKFSKVFTIYPFGTKPKPKSSTNE